ncbi:MAG: polyhydroxyalkanoic acid system family protein [Pseudomonadota bacterium]
MTDISVRQNHQLSPRLARAAAEKIVDRIVTEYDMRSEWNGDILSFSRTGISGTLALHDNAAQVDITLGMMLKSFAPVIEQKICGQMKKVFGAVA